MNNWMVIFFDSYDKIVGVIVVNNGCDILMLKCVLFYDGIILEKLFNRVVRQCFYYVFIMRIEILSDMFGFD